jgi:hypothetical protein
MAILTHKGASQVISLLRAAEEALSDHVDFVDRFGVVPNTSSDKGN